MTQVSSRPAHALLHGSVDVRPPRPVRWRERSRLVRCWRLWRTRRPQTFNEKVRYKLLRDHRPLVVTWADKAAVRDHVASVVGEHYLPRLHHLLDDPADLMTLVEDRWPLEYVLKPTHGSGAAVVVSASAPADARLPEPRWGWVYAHVRPEHAPADHLAAIGRSWVSQLYGQAPTASGPTATCRAA